MTRPTVGELRTCPTDGEPVIFTFKHPGHEYVCVVCGWLGGVLGTPRTPATPELLARYDVLLAQFNEAHGITPPPPLPEPPKCQGCGAVAPGPRKPPHWYARTKDGVEVYVCALACIPADDRALVAPW